MRRRVLVATLVSSISLIVMATANAAITETVRFHSTGFEENVSYVPSSCNEALPGFYTVISEVSGVLHTTWAGINEDNDPIAPHSVVHAVGTIVLIPNDPTLPTYTLRWVGGGVSFSAAEGVSEGPFHGVYYLATTVIHETFYGSDGSSFRGSVRWHLTITPNGETPVAHSLRVCPI
jgi:hypothetical protein